MAQDVSRDVSVTTGHGMVYALVTALLASGWTVAAWSDGATRTGSATGFNAASDLDAVDAWVLVQHTASGRKVSFQRKADSNTWTVQYTEGGQTLSAGNATTPDNHATYTKVVLSNAQWYPTNVPTACKMHIVVDDAACKVIAFWRRTPFIAGTSACGYFMIEAVSSDLYWPANPDPCVIGARFRDDNQVAADLVAGTNCGWHRRGLGGETWLSDWLLESPYGLCGLNTGSPDGNDKELGIRWGRSASGVANLLGVSTLIKGLNPFREPTTGLDGGSDLDRAAFGQVTVANDGVAIPAS